MSSIAKYRGICLMARDYLSIQPSSVPLERVWSVGRHICKFERYQLKVESVQQRASIHIHSRQPTTNASSFFWNRIFGDTQDPADIRLLYELQKSLQYSTIIKDLPSYLSFFTSQESGNIIQASNQPSLPQLPTSPFSSLSQLSQSHSLPSSLQHTQVISDDESTDSSMGDSSPLKRKRGDVFSRPFS